LEPQIFTDFHGFSVLTRRIRENPLFLFVARTMVNAARGQSLARLDNS
jgi:hypothetical protein